MKRPNQLFVLWTLGGFVLLFFAAPFLLFKWGSKPPQSFLTLLIILEMVWLIGGIVIGVFAFRNSKSFGKWVYSVLGIILFLFLADQFFGVSLKIQNRNRKDEFARIYQGAPECRVHISLRSWGEVKAFNKAMDDFAASNSIRKCRNIIYTGYSGPPPCTFKSEHVAIWCGAGSTGIGKFDAHLRIAPIDTNYPVGDFQKLTESLTNTMQNTFTGRIEVTFKEAGTPSP